MSFLRVLHLGILLVGLSACASRGPSHSRLPPVLEDPQAIAAAQAQQATRAAWLQARPQWSFAGRIAINQAGKGGSGRLDWQQQEHGYQVSLSAPVTRQSWQLNVANDGSARLDGLEGGPRMGPDAAALLLAVTGWQIPVHALSDWSRGLVSASGEGQAIYGTDGHLLELRQDGWTIRYTEWQEASAGLPAMPRRIESERGDARVRLLVDAWSLTPQ